MEVKSGRRGTLRSMRLFMEEKQSRLGIRSSLHPLSLKDNILSAPLYMVEEIPRLVREAVS